MLPFDERYFDENPQTNGFRNSFSLYRRGNCQPELYNLIIFRDLMSAVYLTGINMYYSPTSSKKVPVAFTTRIIEICSGT